MWLMLLMLADPATTVYGDLYPSQNGCWKAAMMIEALDPNVLDTQCIRYEDLPPANIG